MYAARHHRPPTNFGLKRGDSGLGDLGRMVETTFVLPAAGCRGGPLVLWGGGSCTTCSEAVKDLDRDDSPTGAQAGC